MKASSLAYSWDNVKGVFYAPEFFMRSDQDGTLQEIP